MKAILLLGAKPSGAAPLPPFLLEYKGKTVLEWTFKKLRESKMIDKIIIPIHKDLLNTFAVRELIRLLDPNAVLLPLHGQTAGALATALMAIDSLDEEELLILNSDEILNFDFTAPIKKYREGKFDGGVVTFDSVNPIYSFVRFDENNHVVEASEKLPISRNATVGFYYFAKGTTFAECAKKIILKNAGLNQRFYVCPVYNELILLGLKVGAFEIPSTGYIPLKNEYQIHSMVGGTHDRSETP